MESVSYPDKLLKLHLRLAPADSVVTGTMPAAVLGVYFTGTRRTVPATVPRRQDFSATWGVGWVG